jgi:hypothetical protein
MIATHKIEELTFDNNYMFLKVDGKTLMIPLNKASKKLLEADDIQKGIYKISLNIEGCKWAFKKPKISTFEGSKVFLSIYFL